MTDLAMGAGMFIGATLACAAAACSAPASPTPKTRATGAGHAHDPGDHNHERGKMLLASDGSYNALLTSHLSAKDGNELDIFIEDKDGPYALPASTVTATARVLGESEDRAIAFTCAPPDERPGNEAPGMCSHYVAKVPWMASTATMRVDTTLTVGTRSVPMVWHQFSAKKYAHHEE